MSERNPTRQRPIANRSTRVPQSLARELRLLPGRRAAA